MDPTHPPLLTPSPAPPDLRTRLAEEGLHLLSRPVPPDRPHALAILGPRGSGTSYLAAAVLRSLDRGPAWGEPSRTPRTLRVDLRGVRGGHPVLEALFRGLEPSFNAQGAATEHLTLLWLRRMRSEARPFRIWLDNLPGRWGGLHRLLEPLLDPGRVLPEGTARLPRFTVVVSGEGAPRDWEELPGRPPTLLVPPWEPSELRALAGAMLRDPGTGVPDARAVDRWVALLLAEGRGVSPLPEMFSHARERARLAGRATVRAEDLEPPYQGPWRTRQARSFDALILDLLRDRTGEGPVPLSELSRALRLHCATLGLPVPSVARLWRRLRRLESLGLLSRETRVGGPGGTRSLLTIRPPEPPPLGSPVWGSGEGLPRQGLFPLGRSRQGRPGGRPPLLGLSRAHPGSTRAGEDPAALDGW
jgi:hypothetical protein